MHYVTANIIWFVIALSAVAVITKVIGCGLPALLQKSSFKDSLTLGVGMVPRGEVAMIIALIGLNQGLIDQGVYAAIILMSLITTILPPIVMRNWLFKK
jgi:Kef-type K+ transport system membrane component KefB